MKIRLALLALLAIPVLASAQTVVHEEWHTVAAPGTAAPIEREVGFSTAGNYEVVVTDLGAQATPAAPLASLRVAITQGRQILGTPLQAAGTLAFTATAGSSGVVRVTGAPGNTPGSGLVRVQVRAAGSANPLLDFIDVLAVPAQAPGDGKYVFDAAFTVPNNGGYDVGLRDLAWPQTIQLLIMAVVEEGGPLVATFTTATNNPHLQTLTLDASKRYHLFAIARPDSGVAGVGGLYSVDVRATGGASVLTRTLPVGAVSSLGTATLPAGAHELVVTDLLFPAALTRGGANVVREGQSAAATLASGTTAFTASAGLHELFGFGEPTAQAAGGSLRVVLRAPGGADLLSAAHVTALAGSGLTAWLFDAPVTAGAFKLRLADYQFPAAFTSVSAAATQGPGLLGTKLDAPGNTDVNAAAGRVQVLAFARPATAGGLFGIDLAPTAGTGPVPLEITQGVGRTFTSRKVSVNADGRYDVDLADLGFPANFTDLAAAVTRGADRVGFIFGGGRFGFDATRGNYFVNFLATPAASVNAGTYALRVEQPPPAPVVTFAASLTSVPTGGSVDLSWSATNATSCTASNGWSGTKAVSGTEKSSPLTTTASFTLSCTGTGGNASKTISVDVAPAASNPKSGGGGAFEWLSLVLLGVGVLARRVVSRQ